MYLEVLLEVGTPGLFREHVRRACFGWLFQLSVLDVRRAGQHSEYRSNRWCCVALAVRQCF